MRAFAWAARPNTRITGFRMSSRPESSRGPPCGPDDGRDHGLKSLYALDGYVCMPVPSQNRRQKAFGYWLVHTVDNQDRNEEPSSAAEREDVADLSNDPIRRRAWLLFLAQKTLPFDQAIEWARAAEQFITGSASETRSLATSARLQSGLGGSRGGRIRASVLEVIKDNPAGLSRGEVIERLHLKGDKAGEASVSNALTALVKRQQIVRRERKYRVE
jgi:hypothetical protein